MSQALDLRVTDAVASYYLNRHLKVSKSADFVHIEIITSVHQKGKIVACCGGQFKQTLRIPLRVFFGVLVILKI